MQPLTPTDTLKPTKAIGPQDRCDSCQAKAFYLVKFPYGDLFFCNHHFVKYEDAFVAKATDIFDESDFIEE
jgi:hypothetical protein